MKYESNVGVPEYVTVNDDDNVIAEVIVRIPSPLIQSLAEKSIVPPDEVTFTNVFGLLIAMVFTLYIIQLYPYTLS